MASSKKVEKYYDDMPPGYLDTYGETIQGCRIKDKSADSLNDFLMKSSGLIDGMTILDAGCGVCGPSIYFAKNLDLQIEALTVSGLQVKIANERVISENLTEKIKITKGDYSYLDKYYSPDKFDQVLFLESLGHAENSSKVIESAYNVIKPGGYIYIKDYFPLESYTGSQKKRLKRVIKNLNSSFCYNTLDLNNCLTALRKTGFQITFIKKLDFQIDFEVSYTFEEKFKIDVWDGKEHFKVAEWLEIKCQKI